MSLLDNFPHECSFIKRIRKGDELGGSEDIPSVTQSGVECWEQQASASEVMDYAKRGITIDRKIYFNSDPNINEQYKIRVDKRNGVAVSNPVLLDVKSIPLPDVSAGLGVLYKVMAFQHTGDNPTS